jgi:hypothetical protein
MAALRQIDRGELITARNDPQVAAVFAAFSILDSQPRMNCKMNVKYIFQRNSRKSDSTAPAE